MKRRSFLTGLCAVAPLLFLPRFEPVKWKRTQRIWVPNPAWFTAQYEICPVDLPPIYYPAVIGDGFNLHALPKRYELVNGYFREVPLCIKS